MTLSGRRAKLVIGALCVSLVLNLAAAGFIGARAVKGFAIDSGASGLLRDYPPELVSAFKSALREDRGVLVTRLGDLRAARRAQHELLTAPSFDRAAFEAAQTEVRAKTDALIQLLQSALADSAATLPDDVRRNLPMFRFQRNVLGSLQDEK